jgi:hypothetical protein
MLAFGILTILLSFSLVALGFFLKKHNYKKADLVVSFVLFMMFSCAMINLGFKLAKFFGNNKPPFFILPF